MKHSFSHSSYASRKQKFPQGAHSPGEHYTEDGPPLAPSFEVWAVSHPNKKHELRQNSSSLGNSRAHPQDPAPPIPSTG